MESTKEAHKWTDAKIEENTYLTKDAAEKRLIIANRKKNKRYFKLMKMIEFKQQQRNEVHLLEKMQVKH